MHIIEDSKKIAAYFVEKLVDYGDFTGAFDMDYGELVHDLDLKDEKYCNVCIQYLVRLHCLEYVYYEDEKENLITQIRVLHNAIDFSESP